MIAIWNDDPDIEHAHSHGDLDSGDRNGDVDGDLDSGDLDVDMCIIICMDVCVGVAVRIFITHAEACCPFLHLHTWMTI